MIWKPSCANRINQKEVVSVHFIKAYVKGLLKNDFVYVETSDVNVLHQSHTKPLILEEAKAYSRK